MRTEAITDQTIGLRGDMITDLITEQRTDPMKNLQRSRQISPKSLRTNKRLLPLARSRHTIRLSSAYKSV